jgi:ATP-dependent DNA helicase RecG
MHVEGVNEGVNRLYQAVKQNPGIRLPELSTRLNVPVKTLERWVKQLRSEKKVVFRGAAKTGGYYVVDGER